MGAGALQGAGWSRARGGVVDVGSKLKNKQYGYRRLGKMDLWTDPVNGSFYVPGGREEGRARPTQE